MRRKQPHLKGVPKGFPKGAPFGLNLPLGGNGESEPVDPGDTSVRFIQNDYFGDDYFGTDYR